MIDCRLYVNGARFADTAAELEAGTPTALAELELNWGRDSTVDQPEAATVRCAVLDPSGGTTFRELVDVGSRLEVRAAGDIGTGAVTDVAIDGSLEVPAVGSTGYPRVVASPAGAPAPIIVAAPVFAGTKALRSSSGYTILIPPAEFTSNPAGWDAIPRFETGQLWTWHLAVFPPRAGSIRVQGRVFRDPTDENGVWVGNAIAVAGDGAWHPLTSDPVVGGSITGWLGVGWNPTLATWPDVAGAWSATPATWADYGAGVVDALEVWAPPSSRRDVIVFAGRVTDLAASLDLRGLRVELIATDQTAELANRYVGAAPWPAEPLGARFTRILAEAGLTGAVTVTIDAPLDASIVSWRDVDRQPVAGLLTEYAAGVDGVLWSAVHSTTGPFVWLEDTAGRAALNTLELVGGVLVIVYAGNRPEGSTVLDGCELPTDPVVWRRDVSDVLTVIDATWLDQTVDTEGNQQPTEHTVTVADPDAVAVHGTRRLGVATNLIAAADAEAVADRILLRTRQPDWRVEGLNYDLGSFPPLAGKPTANALDLLDGTTRLGRAVIVDNVAGWPGGDSIGLFLDGGSYRYDAAGWSLELGASPWTGFGSSPAWSELDPAWQWTQWDDQLEWADLYGVAV